MKQTSKRPGSLHDGESGGTRRGSRDSRPLTGYRVMNDEDVDIIDRDLFVGEEDEADRRRDPLRR